MGVGDSVEVCKVFAGIHILCQYFLFDSGEYFLDRLFFWIIFYQDWKDFLVWVYLFQKEGLS